MEYTIENIPEGLIFQAGDCLHRIDNKEGDRCYLKGISRINGSSHVTDSPSYPLQLIVDEINRGAWAVQEQDYQIY